MKDIPFFEVGTTNDDPDARARPLPGPGKISRIEIKPYMEGRM